MPLESSVIIYMHCKVLYPSLSRQGEGREGFQGIYSQRKKKAVQAGVEGWGAGVWEISSLKTVSPAQFCLGWALGVATDVCFGITGAGKAGRQASEGLREWL